MKILKFIFSLILHIIAISVIFFAFYQFFIWYHDHLPILGVDYFNTYTLAKFFQVNNYLYPSSYLYFWYNGSPLFINVILFWFQLIGFVSKFLPLILTINYTMLISILLTLLFIYFAAYKLSKQHLFSAVLAALVAYSVNLYGSLIWGGSLPFFANQLFFPLVILMLINYTDSGNKRWYWFAILFTGFSLLGHLVNAGAFILPASLLILLIGTRKIYIPVKQRIFEIFIFLSVSFLLAFRLTERVLLTFWGSMIAGRFLNPFGFGYSSTAMFQGQSAVIDPALIAFEHSRPTTLFSDTPVWLFYLFGISIVIFLSALIFGKDKRKMWGVSVWIILVVYSVIYIYLNAYGINILPQGWYRAYWHFPITLALASAGIIGFGLTSLYERFQILKYFFTLVVSIIAVIGLGFTYLNYTATFYNQLGMRSSLSSAYPQAIDLVKNQSDLDKLKPSLVPDWLNPDDRNSRIFISDQLVNIWWSGLFQMPLAKGYLDSVSGSYYLGNDFLLEQAIQDDSLVKNYKYQEDTAYNMAKYYIDWFGVKYFEGGHSSQMEVKPISTYLKNDIEKASTVETQGSFSIYDYPPGNPLINKSNIQKLNYYKFSENITSPILSGYNSPVVLFIGDWPNYESFTKILSMNNLNSKYLITVFSEKMIDAYNKNDFNKFDAIIMSNYKYQNKSRVFNDLTEYVKNGGKIFIDSGGDSRDGKSLDLPEIFPFKKSNSIGVENKWNFTNNREELLLQNIDLNLFSPPKFNDTIWKISFPTDKLKSDAKIILSSDNNPIIINYNLGKGKIIWSGMNFVYHVNHYSNVEESKFFVNLLQSMIELKEKPLVPGEPVFINPQQTSFSLNTKAKGVLYKTQMFDNWKITVNGKTAKAYTAGPTHPGFIYVPLTGVGPSQIYFEYQGRISYYLIWILFWVTIIILTDLSVFNGFFIGKRIRKFHLKTKLHMGSWWEKEE